MAILSDYTAGTVTVSAGGTAVTGVGTAWLTAGFQEGDIFIAADWYSLVASVNSNTSLTLYPVGRRGGALSGAPYRLRYMSDGSRSTAQARELINLLGGSGNLQALGGLASAPNTRPAFTGAGTMTVVADTPFSRALTALAGANGKFPVATGVSSAAMRDIVGTVAQSGGVPTGAIVERGSNANGEYVRFADGTQICYIGNFEVTQAATTLMQGTWAYPAPFAGSSSQVIQSGILPYTNASYVNTGPTSCGPIRAHNNALSSTVIGVSQVGGTTFPSGSSINSIRLLAIGRWF